MRKNIIIKLTFYFYFFYKGHLRSDPGVCRANARAAFSSSPVTASKAILS